MTSTGFAPASGWQGPQGSFQPQYPSYAQQQQPAYLHQQAGYQQQQPGYTQQQQQQAQYQQQQQQMLLQQQMQQLKEQQLQKEAEEKRLRQLEKQKLALMSVNVTKPLAAGSDLESRIGLSLEKSAATSSKPKASQGSAAATCTSADSDKEKVTSGGLLSQELSTSHASEFTTTAPISTSQDVGVVTLPTVVKQPTVTTASGLCVGF